MTGLSRRRARQFYDCIGAGLDSQAFYERPATEDLIAHAQFETAHAVFEFGCGTGRLAAQLLARHLPSDCLYHALDISPRMVHLCRQRIAPWRTRARVEVSAGDMNLPFPAGSFDRFIVTYVLDLLDPADTQDLLSEAHRILKPGGLFCLVSLTNGATGGARAVARVWRAVYAVAPLLVGGCRPIDVEALLSSIYWDLRYDSVVTTFGLSSEVTVAARRAAGADES
jgi:ubiquinone/menaquinone biosynthesis C-methylase UbiE